MMKSFNLLFASLLVLLVWPLSGMASVEVAGSNSDVDLTNTWLGISAVILFVVAYCFVIAEEFLHMRKSKPVILVAGLIWILVAIAFANIGDTVTPGAAIRHNLLEYAELLLFLLAAMTYINTMEERNVFEKLRSRLVGSGYSLRQIFWITGGLAFVISPVADNLTTALVMAAVVISVGIGNTGFITLACINIVVAANAGGAFSPFGDITTLMVWQKGMVSFSQFFVLFTPSLVNWLVPAAIMSFVLPNGQPQQLNEEVEVKPGGYNVVFLFLLTIALAVVLHTFLHLPPVLGMMTGMGLLKIYGYFIRRDEISRLSVEISGPEDGSADIIEHKAFDIFRSMKRAEWDTLMFFYGVILSVGGLGTLGYLALLSETFYVGYGATWANIAVGVLSAIIDNIPVMFAVLTMQPDMSLGQWLLVTLTAGVGGSLLSIGSAAGVALMGQARGVYTFFAHLKWTWAIALGYAASIWVHLLVNAELM
ncbi:MAG: sodium:proton antiporter [Gammaproteobacteria bacterium]|nr:sodium:proton antiporter [Gammaproteobacteria bacterium]